MSFTLEPLPFNPEDKDMDPFISSLTFSFHHGKHHKTYVDKLNGTGIKGTNQDLVQIIINSSPQSGSYNKAVFNNAAQHYNHTFFWNSIKPRGGGKPDSSLKIAQAIEKDLGGYDNFRKKFSEAAATQFGSGWAWLVLNKDKKVQVMDTHDADVPFCHGSVPLVTLDVWEHAYYLDYQNRRPAFIEVYLDHLINWDFAEENYKKAMSQ